MTVKPKQQKGAGMALVKCEPPWEQELKPREDTRPGTLRAVIIIYVQAKVYHILRKVCLRRSRWIAAG